LNNWEVIKVIVNIKPKFPSFLAIAVAVFSHPSFRQVIASVWKS